MNLLVFPSRLVFLPSFLPSFLNLAILSLLHPSVSFTALTLHLKSASNTCWVLWVARLQPREADRQGPGLTCGPHCPRGRQSVAKQTSLGQGNGRSQRVMKLELGGVGREGSCGRLQMWSPSWGDLVNALFRTVESSSHTCSHSPPCPFIYPSTAFRPAFIHLFVPHNEATWSIENKIVWGHTGLGSLGSSDSKESACNVGDLGSIPGSSLGWEDPLKEGMATHSSILPWRIPMNRGAWRATVHGVTKSQTRLSN